MFLSGAVRTVKEREAARQRESVHVYVQMPACVCSSATGYQPKSKSLNASFNSQAVVTSHKSRLVTDVLIKYKNLRVNTY